MHLLKGCLLYVLFSSVSIALVAWIWFQRKLSSSHSIRSHIKSHFLPNKRDRVLQHVTCLYHPGTTKIFKNFSSLLYFVRLQSINVHTKHTTNTIYQEILYYHKWIDAKSQLILLYITNYIQKKKWKTNEVYCLLHLYILLHLYVQLKPWTEGRIYWCNTLPLCKNTKKQNNLNFFSL